MEQKTEASQAVKFRKKPVEIEAIQWTGKLDCLDAFNIPELHQSLGSKNVGIPTLEGTMIAHVGDWIIKGVKGEFYPCKPDIFELTYERAALKAQPAPTEAQGESEKLAARLAELGVTNLKYTPGSDLTVSRERVLQEITRAVERIQFGESGLFLTPTEDARDEDSARLDALYYAMCIKPFIAAICTKEQWLKSIDNQIDRARASAETGGVKP